MANYTIELKDVVACGHNIFDFKYPFYDERKRPEFEEKFIKHFYFREICCPTVDRFKMYLQDKMLTVFPYYNELFNAASIEYSILNNYNLTEEFTRSVEGEGKSAGISSNVAQLFGTQETETNSNGTVDTTGNSDTVGKDTEKETTNSNTEGTNHSETTTSEASETTNKQVSSGTSSETVTDSRKNVRKFLDTPQGKVDLTDTEYLTDLTDTTDSGNQSKNGTNNQTVNSEGEGSKTGSSETTGGNTSDTDTTRNLERDSTVNQETTGREVSENHGTSTVTDEQKSTQDTNTRLYSDSKQTETHKLTRIGNIGVDTDSDMIEKHIRLQKTLKQIELLFFNECEDLFMMVY